MGKLDKRVLSQWSDFECERQLFINLGKDKKENPWFKPNRDIILLRRRRNKSALVKQGHAYEERVYNSLKRLPTARYKEKPDGSIAPLSIDKRYLEEMDVTSPVILLEHKFAVNETFTGQFLRESDIFSTDNLRPDIMILQQIEGTAGIVTNDNRYEERKFPEGAIGIRIFDIKATNEENVGKKHFIEILFYQHALAQYLKDVQLDDRFFVLADGNGILPNLDTPIIPTLEILLDSVVTYDWQDVSRVYIEAIERIRRFEKIVPIAIERVPTRLQPACGRCSYLDDCKYCFGIKNNNKEIREVERSEKETWAIDLLPYLEPGVAEELKFRGIETIGDFVRKKDEIQILDTPNPLYAELPLLRLKAESIVDGEVVKPNPAEVTSVKIPKYSDLSIIIDASQDPVNDVVFYFAVHFSIFIGGNTRYRTKFSELMQSLYRGVQTRDIVQIFTDEGEVEKEIVEGIDEARRIIEEFRSSSTVDDKRDDIGENEVYSFSYVYISGGKENRDEFNLTKNSVTFLFKVFKFCTIIEQLVTVRIDEKREVFPKTAVYYWSHEIIQIIENLLERNMQSLFLDEEGRRGFQYITTWLSPSESTVKSGLQVKKIYDLRMFAETILGFPLVLNYTWHDIRKHYYKNFFVDWNFWNPHFNYMDFNKWHEYLNEEDNMKKPELLSELKKQAILKVQSLNSIRIEFQKSRNLISVTSSPVRNKQFQEQDLPDDFHDIAKMWYLFSKLTGTIEELQTDEIRHMFPDHSIANLVAAQVSEPLLKEEKGSRGGIKYRYTFTVTGLSTNVKVGVGDTVLLVPQEMREFNVVKWWRVKIEKMEWNAGDNSYRIETKPERRNFVELCKEYAERDPTRWFIYIFATDNWTTKLFSGERGFLTLRNIGRSWLGHRLALLWEISRDTVKIPTIATVDSSELYMYHPTILEQIRPSKEIVDLYEQREYPPNPSQRKAILNSLNRVISFIQGPPGTGKSQTITTLIDEILRNEGKSVKILITAFSYQAMQVILDKLNSQPKDYPAKTVQKVFLRSSYRGRVDGAVDLMKDNKTWKLDGRSRIVTKKTTIVDHLEDSFILFANAHQIYHLLQEEGEKRPLPQDFGFDYIICDEASQMPVDQFLAPILLTKKTEMQVSIPSEVDEEGRFSHIGEVTVVTEKQFEDFTKVILVGDQNQLPPVQQIKPPRKLEKVLSSIFSYYIEYMGFEPVQLNINYRSHRLIVDYTRSLGMYQELTAAGPNASKKLSGDMTKVTKEEIRRILDPDKIIVSLIHNSKFDTAVSEIEAELAKDVAVEYFRARDIQSEEEEKRFWREYIGIVAPHNAHGRLIIRKIQQTLRESNLTLLSGDDLMRELSKTIFSVEKFQGSDRDCIIGTIGVSSKIQLEKEEDFIYQLNRFNVLTSRGKSKVILIISRNYYDYIPKDRETMKYAAKMRKFVEMCSVVETLSYRGEEIEFRYLSDSE